MDSDPINWYPEPVPMWNLQTPTIFVPPSSTLVNPPLSPSPHTALQSIPTIQPPSVPTCVLDPAAAQICNAFAVFQQGMHEAFNDLWAAFRKTEERLKHSRRLIQDRSHLIQKLRTKVPTATTAATTIQYAPEDPMLPSPWRGLIDGSSGSLYYWNPETNQTQYERPCEETAQHPLRTLTSSDDSVHPNPQPFHHSPRYPLTVPSSATSIPSNPPLIHPTISHPTQPIYLHRKQLRVLRRRVSMAAIRRLFKATRKPYLISTVGKDSRTQVNRKTGFWVVKTKSGFFPDFVEEICQLSMDPTAPTDTSHLAATNPSCLVLVSDVTEQHEVLSSVAVAGEVSLASPKPTSDVVVCNGITSCASFACTQAVSPALVRLDLLPSLTESKPSQVPLEADRVKVSTVDSIYSTFAPGADVGVEVTNVDVNVTDMGSILGDMLELLILGTVKKYGSSLDGFICNEDNHCPASTLVQQVTMKDKFYKEDFILVYPFCQLGNFDKPEGHCIISLLWDEVHLSPKTVAMRKKLCELISKPNSSFGVSEPNLESPGDSMKGQLGLSHCYSTLKATAESGFLIVSGTPPITVHQLRAPLLKFERQLHYEIIDFEVLANDYSKLAFFSADCSLFLHENYRQHCSLWNSIMGKVMVCDCWSCALLFAAPYDTLAAQIKNGALYCIDTILQSFPDIVRDNRRSVLVDVGGATLLMVELNRVLRLRGSFVRSAIPAYHKFHADIGIREAMSEFTKSNCWDLMVLRTDGPKKVVVVLFWNPSTPERYNARALSFVTADPLFTGSSMIVLGYSDEPIVCVSQVFSCQLASESFTSCYMSMEIAMMKASHPPTVLKVVIATNCQQLTISVVQIDAYHHSDPSLMVVSVHSFSSYYRNNEPLFVISCNERQIVRSPQRVIPTSKMEGDSVILLRKHVVIAIMEDGHDVLSAVTWFYTLASFYRVIAVHVDLSLIFETEKNHYKRCSKTHMLESTQRRLMLLQEPVLLKAASPRVLRTHPLALPSDNSIHPNLACILSKHHSLVVEAAIMMRYSSDPLENGVVLMTYMQKTFQTDHKEEPFVTASASTFNSPTHAIVRKLVSLLLMVGIHSSPPLRDNILREDGCSPFFLGNTMVIYINEQLSLKSKNQGLDIGYGVYNGNYSSPVSSSLHLSDFIPQLIAFGFGAMDFGDLALVPHKLFSILMWSNEAFLVILLSASIHFRLLVFVITSHLLHCPTREALRIISIMPHSPNWMPTSNSHESVYLSALRHTWQVTTGDGINFGATLTNITALDMTYSTSWYLPLFTGDPNANQKTFGAIVAYLEELKVKLFADSHFGALQTVDLEEYGDSLSSHRARHGTFLHSLLP